MPNIFDKKPLPTPEQEAAQTAAAIKRFKKALEMAETNGDTLGAEALRDCIARREARFETG